jgi:hypothetical protein
MALPYPPHAPARPPQPFLVALAAWALPGLGYLLVGQRARGLTTGITILALFVAGLLIGGVRALDPPMVSGRDVGTSAPRRSLRDEILAKPWYIAQVLTGPVGLVASYGAAWAGEPDPTNPDRSRGEESHARVNEIAVLYMAVAGMLNLLTIIDSAHRAGRLLEAR